MQNEALQIQRCSQQLYFDNTSCESCSSVLGYVPDRTILSALDEAGDTRWRPLAAPDDEICFCANATHDACNWLVPNHAPNSFCDAWRINRTIPDLSNQQHLTLWRRLAVAKHWMIYGIKRLGLPLIDKNQDAVRGLAFDFLADDNMLFRDQPTVITGHAEGLITINLAQADDAVCDRARQDMAEPYRTLLGHFRHEISHYYWERLVCDRADFEPFRSLFGHERQYYSDSLNARLLTSLRTERIFPRFLLPPSAQG